MITNMVAAAAIAASSLTANGGGAWICNELDKSPTVSTVKSIVLELISDGYTADNGGPEYLVGAVVDGCPEYLPVLKKFAAQYG